MSQTTSMESHPTARHYQITVQGAVDPSWSDWMGGLALNVEVDQQNLPITRLSGVLPDQGALRGVLNRLWDLNLTLLSVSCQDEYHGGKK